MSSGGGSGGGGEEASSVSSSIAATRHLKSYDESGLLTTAANVVYVVLGVASLFLGVACLVCCVGGFFYSRRRWRRQALRRYASCALAVPPPPSPPPSINIEIGVPLIGDNHYHELSGSKRQKRPVDLWEIKREKISIDYDHKLGSGAYGSVFVADLAGEAGICRAYTNLAVSRFRDCKVAVKMLPPFADESARLDFQREILFMKTLKYHEHIMSLLGFVNDADKPLLVLEYCKNGDLLHYVRRHRDEITRGGDADGNHKVKDLISYSWQIANGLEYLHSLKNIHRDVALRNVLLDCSNNCKIADFGLCRQPDSYIYTTKGGRLPIRWMAPESLANYEYSTASDVHELMNRCFLAEAAERPNFTQLCASIAQILNNASSAYGYLLTLDTTAKPQTDEAR